MTNLTDTKIADAKSGKHKLTTTSKDGKWKTFHKHAGLMQYVPSGMYFARRKVNDVVKRVSLETDVFTTAKDRLSGKLKELHKPPSEIGTFADARALYEADLDAAHDLTEQTKVYRKTRIAALLKSWPKLDPMRLEKISVPDCRDWAKSFSDKFEEGNFNNTLGTARAIVERGGISKDANPFRKIKRLGVKPKALQLPEPDQFEKLLEAIEKPGKYPVPGKERKRTGNYVAPQSKDCADFVRFLTFSGCRKSEAKKVIWSDVYSERGEIKVHNAKRSKTGNHSPFRFVAIIPAMRQLLERLRCQNPHAPTDRVCVVSECEKSLTRACNAIGIPRITHHDLRHLFATRCIEAGVDIPTVARWLGHVDGGALAMKVYGHLRRTHSQQQAQLVTFGTTPLPANVTPFPQAALSAN